MLSSLPLLHFQPCAVFWSQIGVHVFTKRPRLKDQPELNPDDVITYLGKHKQALLLYLEYLVLERKIQVQYILKTSPCLLLCCHHTNLICGLRDVSQQSHFPKTEKRMLIMATHLHGLMLCRCLVMTF